MNNLAYLGEIEAPSEKIKCQILINIMEGKEYYKSNVNTYAVVEIPSYFRRKTAIRKTTTAPSYFKKFIIDLPSLLLNDLLNLQIIITVYESHNLPLLSKPILGSASIGIATIWSEPDQLFRNKWLSLVNREKNDFSIKGYLKCDLFMFLENKSFDNLSPLKPLDSLVESNAIDEKNSLIPSGYKKPTTYLAKYSIKVYKGEMIRFLNDGPKWLSIDFGIAPESSILLDMNKTELNWNQEYSTINIYPPLSPIILIKFVLSGKIVASRILSMHNFNREDGVPSFGPAFLHFTSLETQQYFGRILMSVETELVPPETENIKILQIDSTVPIPNEKLMYHEIIIIGLILRVNNVQKRLIKSNDITISMEYGEYNFSSEHQNKKFINLITPRYKVENVEKDFYKLLIEEDTKPCVFLIVNLTSVEYYAMFASNLFSSTINNMETCIYKTSKYLYSQESNNINKTEIVHEMLITLSVYNQQFRHLYDENEIIQKHIHSSCVSYMGLFQKMCLNEIKKIKSLKYNEPDVLSLVNKIKNIINKLLFVFRKNKSYYGPPNIFLNLCDGKKVVSKCQIQTRHFLHSNIPEFEGKYCGQIQPWFLQATEKKDHLFDEIMETIFWIGPYKDFNLGLREMPGLLLNERNGQPCSQYKFKLYDERLLQLNAHVSHAALCEKYYKKYGWANLMARVIFNDHSLTTKVINSNLSPFWNVSISFEPIKFTQYGDAFKNSPMYAVIQLCHVQTKAEESIEDVIAFAVINLKGIEMTTRSTLDWIDIVDSSEKIAKMCVAVELMKRFNDSTETVYNSDVILLNHMQPKLRVYQLIVLFWGLREFEKDLRLCEPFVRMFYSGIFIDSNAIKNVNSFPNFPDIMNKKFVLSVELPENPNLMPSICFQLYTKIKKEHVPLGVCGSQTIDNFLVPVISETDQNLLRSEYPFAHSVLDVEEDEKRKTVKTNKKITVIKTSSGKFKLIYDFLWNTIECITPSTLKILFLWIFQFVMLVLTILCDIMIWLCPCINTITIWTSNQFKHLIGHFEKKYDTLIDENFEENEKEFNWWTKYYGFKYQKNNFKKNKHKNESAFTKIPCKFLPFFTHCRDQSNKMSIAERYSKINSLTIYDTELENIPEFDRFEDNIKKFKFYGFKGDHKKSTTIATLKGNIHLYLKSVIKDEQEFSRSRKLNFSDKESQIWPRLKSNASCKIIVRVYILRAHNLHPSDINGLSDPYIKILFGKHHQISDQKNYVPKSLNPLFGRCYEKEISLPECSILKIKVMDYDRCKNDELIGETIIDIESRYFSKHRAHCGLPKQYNKDGYNRWRDCEKPSKILHKLCLLYSLKPPIYTENSVIIGSKIFNIEKGNMKTDRQSLALNVLNHWQDMPVIGYHLVPEYVETRTLFNPKMLNIHQGTLEMWIDMFPKSDCIPEIVDVKPPIVENYELRVIIWSVTDVKLIDNNLLTGEKHSDIYIKGWLPGTEKQSTDIHYRSLNGEGSFNWRFKFSFLYNKTENIIVQKTKNFFSLDGEEQLFLPKLHLQIWDSDALSPDSYIGFLTLDLWNLPRGTKSSWRCTSTENAPRINLFKVKKTRGWWPFTSTGDNQNSIVGKVDAEIQIMTKLEADKSPVGLGRNKPQPLPVPKRPSIQYLKSVMEPFKFMFQNLLIANKTKCIYIVVIFLLLLFVMLFVYSIPGYLVKKLMNA